MAEDKKGRRSTKRIDKSKGTVTDIEGNKKDISVMADVPVRTRPVRKTSRRGRPVSIHVREPAVLDEDFTTYLDTKMNEEDRKAMALYLGENNINARVLVDNDYHKQLRSEVAEYPFWLKVPRDDRERIERLYIELHLINMQLQAYNRLSDAIPEEEADLYLAVVNKRAFLIEEQNNISDQIGEIVSENLRRYDEGDEVLIIPDGFEDELDYCSAIHQKIVVNSNSHTWNIYGSAL